MVTGLYGVLALLAVAGPIEADTGDCPSARAVEERLLPLLPPAAERAPRIVHLQRRGDRLTVELRDAGGLLLTARDLAATSSCADLAAAAAVVLAAAWQSAPTAELPPLQLDSPVALRTPAPIRSRLPWEVAASAWVSFAGSGASAVAGGTVEAFLAPRGSRLGVRVALLGGGPREEPLGVGRATWTRLALGAGPRYSFVKRRFLISVHAEGLLGAVLVRGEGFAESYQSAAVDLGLGGGVRVGLRLGPVAPFIGGTLLGWLRPQTLQVAGSSATAELPRFEVLLAGGMALGNFP